MKIGFLPLLTLLFIGLKLGEVIDWSWWLVLSPMWLGIPLIVGFLMAILVFVEVLNKR